ncbi:hypothetical protein GGH92_005234, partial [Coemansia sp. RSA 2673]
MTKPEQQQYHYQQLSLGSDVPEQPPDHPDQAELDRVICKDGRVFHACEICRKRRSRCDGVRPKCTSCQKRGLECEYRAMRKRGRHGKKSMLPLAIGTSGSALALLDTTDSPSHGGGGTDSVWSIASPVSADSLSHSHPHGLGAGLHSPDSTLSLLDSFPRFFSMPSDLPIAAAAAAAATQQSVLSSGSATAMDSMIHAINSASPPAHYHHHHHHHQHQQQQQHNPSTLFSQTSPMAVPTNSAFAAVAAAAAAASLPAHGASMQNIARHTQSMDMLAGMSSDPNPAAQTMQSFQRNQFQPAPQQPQQSNYQPQYLPQQQQRFMSPAENHAAFTNVFLSSIGATQQQNSQQQTYQQQAYQQQELHARQPLLFGSSTPPALTMHQRQAQAQTLAQQQQPPMVFRSLSANSSAFDGSSLALSPSSSSLSMVAAASMHTNFVSPIALGSMLPPTSPAGVSSMSAAAAAAAAAAVAAFQFSSPPPPPSSSSSSMLAVANGNNGRSQQEQEVAALLANHSHPSMLSVRLSASSATQPMPLSFSAAPPFSLSADIGAASCLTNTIAAGFPPTPITAAGPAAVNSAVNAAATSSSSGAKPRRTRSRQGSVGSRSNNATTPSIASLAATMRRHPGGRRIGTSRKRSGGDWSRSTIEEELVLEGLSAEGADTFGRPLFDVAAYPLPAHADLDEHMNGTFEYFYIGIQTMHEVTFRKRLAGGNVSPVLIYAIMAIASRYSRRPSLHSLNGMAFLNGDRHASTACGLISILLNHSNLGTVDCIHGMLFLSVYFMGQGNMLKSRMYLVKAVCTARTMGFQNMDATFTPSNTMIAFRGHFDKPQDLSAPHPRACSCPKTIEDRVELETKRRIWWFLVSVDYFTANVMNVPLEIPPDSYCVRLPCSDEEWRSPMLSKGTSDMPGAAEGSSAGGIIDGLSFSQVSANQGYSSPLPDSSARVNVPCDLGFGDRLSSAKQGRDYLRLNGFHDCRPPWLYHPGAFYLERLMIEFCDHLRRLNNLRSLAIRSFFYVEPVFVDEAYPYLKRRRQNLSWADRLNKVKSSWSWLHMQVNKWLDSILLRFSEEINRVPSDRFNRQYRHQYYYYLIAAHSTIIMSHGVIIQLFMDFSRYIRQQQQQYEAYEQQARTRPHTPTQGHSAFTTGLSDAAARSSGGGHGATANSQVWGSSAGPAPPVAYGAGGMSLSEGLSEFAIGTVGSAVASLINIAQSLAASGGGSSVHGSSAYGSVIGSPVTNPNGNVLPTQSSFDDML